MLRDTKSNAGHPTKHLLETSKVQGHEKKKTRKDGKLLYSRKDQTETGFFANPELHPGQKTGKNII